MKTIFHLACYCLLPRTLMILNTGVTKMFESLILKLVWVGHYHTQALHDCFDRGLFWLLCRHYLEDNDHGPGTQLGDPDPLLQLLQIRLQRSSGRSDPS